MTNLSKANNYITKDGRAFTIRQPTENDAAQIISYSKILFASTDQVLTTLEEYTITVEDEKKWIYNLTQNLNSQVFIAELNCQIVGLLFFIANTKRKNSHSGEFGVSVHPEFQGVGVGRRLIEKLLLWADTNSQIEKVYLNVFETNKNAIELYKKIGFLEEGRFVKSIKQFSGEYVDVIQMYILT